MKAKIIIFVLSIHNRLVKKRDFNLLWKHGRWFNAPNYDLKMLDLEPAYIPCPPKEKIVDFTKQLKVAFAVGVKLSKSAVKRNRLKRQMREVVRLLIGAERLRVGCYLLFVAKSGAAGLDFQETEKQLVFLLAQAKCFV